MNITDITLEHRLKIGKSSITVKDANTGKTKGIIINCRTKENRTCRDNLDLHSKLRKLGLTEFTNAVSSANFVLKDGELYYLYNVKTRRFIEEYGDKYVLENEQNRVNKMEKIARALRNNGISVIEYLPA